MKAREFERQLRGWSRGLGHSWEPVSVVRSAPGERMERFLGCRRCGAKMFSVRHSRVNFLIPYAGSPFFNKVVRVRNLYQGHEVPFCPEWSPRFPGLFRSLSSPCRHIAAAKAVLYTLED